MVPRGSVFRPRIWIPGVHHNAKPLGVALSAVAIYDYSSLQNRLHPCTLVKLQRSQQDTMAAFSDRLAQAIPTVEESLYGEADIPTYCTCSGGFFDNQNKVS
jgi:hypothetical protein